MLNIQEIHDRQTWESFVASYPDKTFTQAWAWGQFNAQTENNVFYLGIYNSKFKIQNLEGVALIIKVKARRGTFLFCPHGPLLDWSSP
ncbi:MAG: peptidoglycan bridge formation glycyltransferase FemA/FemB family protein [Candidatus Gracilibacteria bacterium]|nr:peptidoglycan bridge formation glycyltransferase FemA/FemB family protein [Candidatus Gracilibacteria bacterium]